MKKFVCLLLSIVMMVSSVNIVFCQDEQKIPQRVEISFKVGDSTLIINSNPVTVETPYVAGAGTTLVPLRVITEAFGARVTWVNETKEIKLEYPDVNIVLQINNVNATVNNHTETLPEAPVLSPGGVTMVPLRFISETFGATVSYDNATAAITVIKETTEEESTISSSTDLPKVGDSYWKWSMLTPVGMMMTDRLVDGSKTVFEAGESETLYVHIRNMSLYDGNAYEDSYEALLKELSSYTLSKADKGVDEQGNKCFRLTARDKKDYMDFYTVFRDDYCFEVGFVTEVKSENIAMLTSIIDSFKLEFASDNEEEKITYDLSNIDEDGYRLVQNENLKISFRVPANFGDMGLEQLNVIALESFDKTEPSSVSVGVYSKKDNISAKSMAETDRQYHSEYYNKEFCAVSDIAPYSANTVGDNACYYRMITQALYGINYEKNDIFFEKGDYVYNVTIVAGDHFKNLLHIVMDSLVVEELNQEEAGVFIRVERGEETLEKISVAKCDFEIDTSWEKLTEADDAIVFANENTGAVLSFKATTYENEVPNLSRIMNELLDHMEINCEKVRGVENKRIGNRGFYTFQVCQKDEKTQQATYITIYAALKGWTVYMFALSESQETANAGVRANVEKILESITFGAVQ